MKYHNNTKCGHTMCTEPNGNEVNSHQTKSLEFSFPIGIRTHVYAFKKCSFHKREPDFPLVTTRVTINNERDTPTIYVQLSRVVLSLLRICATKQETMLPTMLTCIQGR